jgi:hypothetical protein
LFILCFIVEIYVHEFVPGALERSKDMIDENRPIAELLNKSLSHTLRLISQHQLFG